MNKYAMRTFGIFIPKVGLTYDEEVLLMRIREAQRRANLGGVRHEPGNPIKIGGQDE